MVYQWCRHYSGPEHDAADLVQEVFRTLLLNLQNFRPERGGPGFRAWIRSITLNKVRDFFRSSAYRNRAVGASQFLDPMDAISGSQEMESSSTDEQRELTARVLQLIQVEFEESTWRAFWRCTVDGASSTIVADELGISCAAVRQAKYRVLRRLRDELNELA